MNVLVIGGGAREHALCRSLSLDPAVTALHCAPGNAGIAEVAELHQVDMLDGAAVTALAGRIGADLVVVGPEAPLVAGVADAVRAAGILCFGPSRKAARLEGSKAFAKEVMAAAGVPTARGYVCGTAEEVDEALDAFGPPYVVKDDGLAAGKGVVVTDDMAVARDHARACSRVVVEEYLDGPEVSLFAVTDGTTVVPLQPAQDFKRAFDGDAGPNTGGMGAYSPLPWADPKLVDDVVHTVLQPTVDEMRRRGTPFCGLLYAGLALTARGVRVIEFNARFGDPETQVVLARLRTPLAAVLLAAARGGALDAGAGGGTAGGSVGASADESPTMSGTGTLADLEPLRWSDDAAVTVVVAAHDYPGKPRTGDRIEGLAEVAAEDAPHAYVLHAGTRRDGADLVSAGGRVLSVTATGSDLAQARHRAYTAVGRIRLDGSQHRTDIAAWAAETAQVQADGAGKGARGEEGDGGVGRGYGGVARRRRSGGTGTAP